MDSPNTCPRSGLLRAVKVQPEVLCLYDDLVSPEDAAEADLTDCYFVSPKEPSPVQHALLVALGETAEYSHGRPIL